MRLIDADAFKKWAWKHPDIIVDGDRYILADSIINFAYDHSIDAVTVVRCKDCVQSGNCSMEDAFRLVARIENPFCCVGKQKEGAEDAQKECSETKP